MSLPSRAGGWVLSILLTAATHAADLAATPKKPVTDVYHGVQVVDDYRWLADIGDPAVRAWSDAQNRYARAYLDALPLRREIYERLKQVRTYPSPRYAELQFPAQPAVRHQGPAAERAAFAGHAAVSRCRGIRACAR